MALNLSPDGITQLGRYYLIQTSGSTLIMFFIVCGIVSFVIAFLFYFLMPQSLKQNKWLYVWLITFSGTFMPIVGAVFSCLTLYLTQVFGKKISDIPIKKVQPPSFSLEEDFNIQTFGEGSARTRMKQKNLSNEARTQSLVVLGRLNNSEANKVIQESMNDNDDQIRLLAFSLLDNKERKIYEKIDQLEETLKETLDINAVADIESQLAFSYWEIIYLNLASGELYEIALKKAMRYAQSAVKVSKKQINLLVLLGRIYMALEKYDEALNIFTRLQEADEPFNTYAPYLAELYFHNRLFQTVKETLQGKLTLKYIPKVAPIVDYWCPNE